MRMSASFFLFALHLSAWKNSASAGRIFMTFVLGGFMSKKANFVQNRTNITGALRVELLLYYYVGYSIYLVTVGSNR